MRWSTGFLESGHERKKPGHSITSWFISPESSCRGAWFVPSAMLRYWKSKNRTEKYGLLFSMICFLSVLIFFSLSRGKRSDYILPLYPAASVIVGQFWFSLVERDKPDYWNSHLRTLSLDYFLVSFFVAAGLLVL
jgi:4-amino-4-deoxy-L-arabinose transferase-like glycosyltransferase